MTQTINALLKEDFAGNQLNVVYNELLDQRLLNEWQLGDDKTELHEQHERHCLMLRDNHTLAVTMDWIHGLAREAFRFITNNEGDKFVRNLYMVRLAADDLFIGAAYHEMNVGELYGPDALVEVLGMVKEQVDREVLGAVTKDCNYNVAEARKEMANFWYFMTCGLVGTRAKNLAYGNDILVLDGKYQQPRVLVNTGETTTDLNIGQAVDTLNALL